MIKRLNRVKITEIDNVNLQEMLYTVIDRASKISLIHAIRHFISYIFLYHINMEKIKSGKIVLLFSYSYLQRKDHLKKIYEVKDCIADCLCLISCQKFHIDLNKIALIPILLSWGLLMKKQGIPIRSGIYLSTIFMEAYETRQMIEKAIKRNGLNPKLFVSLCDAHPIDYYLTYQFNCKNICTATLQHGIFSRHKPWIFTNSHSKYFLAYNNMTLDEAKISGYQDNGKILILGPPSLIRFPNQNLMSHKKNFVIGVALLGLGFEDSNIQIIDYLKNIKCNFDIKFVVRDHADVITSIKDFKNAIRDSSDSILSFIDHSDFIITGNSSVFFRFLLQECHGISS